MSVSTTRNSDLSPLEGLSGLSLCLNARRERSLGQAADMQVPQPLRRLILHPNILFLSYAWPLLSHRRSHTVHFHRLLSMGPKSGLFGLLLGMWIACCSPRLPPPFFFNSPLHGNNGEAICTSSFLPKRCSSETQRFQIASDQSIPLRWLRSLRTLRALEICVFFSAGLASQDSDKELEDDRSEIRRSM